MLAPEVRIGTASPPSNAPRATVPNGVPAVQVMSTSGAAALMRDTCAATLRSAAAKCSCATGLIAAFSGCANAAFEPAVEIGPRRIGPHQERDAIEVALVQIAQRDGDDVLAVVAGREDEPARSGMHALNEAIRSPARSSRPAARPRHTLAARGRSPSQLFRMPAARQVGPCLRRRLIVAHVELHRPPADAAVRVDVALHHLERPSLRTSQKRAGPGERQDRRDANRCDLGRGCARRGDGDRQSKHDGTGERQRMRTLRDASRPLRGHGVRPWRRPQRSRRRQSRASRRRTVLHSTSRRCRRARHQARAPRRRLCARLRRGSRRTRIILV